MYIHKYVLRILLLSTAFVVFDAAQANEKLLCVDVGATRIKWAVLNDTLSYEDLKSLSVSNTPTEDWLSSRLPDLFLRKGPLLNTTSSTPDRISLAVRGPVYAHSLYLYRPRGVPYYLADSLQQSTQVPVCVENDGIAFTCGVIKLLQLQGDQVEFPLMTMTLGTGLAIMIAESPQKITAWELYKFPEFVWNEYDTVFYDLFGYSAPQWNKEGPLGWRMLRHIPSHWSDIEKSSAYRKLFRAALADFNGYFQSIGIDIKAIAVGQGNSRFLEDSDIYLENAKCQYLLSPQNMEQTGLSSDLLSVLGPWAIVTDNILPGEQQPPFEMLR